MTAQPHPHKDCHKCPVFFKCEQLPPCASSQQRIEQVIKELEAMWAKYENEYTHQDTDEWDDPATFGDGAVEACKKAIAILRGEQR